MNNAACIVAIHVGLHGSLVRTLHKLHADVQNISRVAPTPMLIRGQSTQRLRLHCMYLTINSRSFGKNECSPCRRVLDTTRARRVNPPTLHKSAAHSIAWKFTTKLISYSSDSQTKTTFKIAELLGIYHFWSVFGTWCNL